MDVLHALHGVLDCGAQFVEPGGVYGIEHDHKVGFDLADGVASALGEFEGGAGMFARFHSHPKIKLGTGQQVERAGSIGSGGIPRQDVDQALSLTVRLDGVVFDQDAELSCICAPAFQCFGTSSGER